MPPAHRMPAGFGLASAFAAGTLAYVTGLADVMNYPKAIKAFYRRVNDDDRLLRVFLGQIALVFRLQVDATAPAPLRARSGKGVEPG
jgi:hypothetical protein